MPVMTGQEFIREVRAKDTSVPVLVLSSDFQEISEAECQALGISKFLNKPINADQIVNDVNEAIKKTGVLQLCSYLLTRLILSQRSSTSA